MFIGTITYYENHIYITVAGKLINKHIISHKTDDDYYEPTDFRHHEILLEHCRCLSHRILRYYEDSLTLNHLNTESLTWYQRTPDGTFGITPTRNMNWMTILWAFHQPLHSGYLSLHQRNKISISANKTKSNYYFVD